MTSEINHALSKYWMSISSCLWATELHSAAHNPDHSSNEGNFPAQAAAIRCFNTERKRGTWVRNQEHGAVHRSPSGVVEMIDLEVWGFEGGQHSILLQHEAILLGTHRPKTCSISMQSEAKVPGLGARDGGDGCRCDTSRRHAAIGNIVEEILGKQTPEARASAPEDSYW